MLIQKKVFFRTSIPYVPFLRLVTVIIFKILVLNLFLNVLKIRKRNWILYAEIKREIFWIWKRISFFLIPTIYLFIMSRITSSSEYISVTRESENETIAEWIVSNHDANSSVTGSTWRKRKIQRQNECEFSERNPKIA